jgi:early secretory antigenic target protein ESAT-6
MSIRVGFESLDEAARNIDTTTSSMTTTLDELETRLQSTLADWQGDAQASYWTAKAEWERAAASITMLLGSFKDAVISSNELMIATEIRNSNRFA